MIYTALQIGLSEKDFWKLDPFLFYELVETHIRTERMRVNV